MTEETLATPVAADLQDKQARDQIIRDVERSFFVEAGAGTGKTHTMVERIVEGLLSGAWTPTQLVAITFTRAAAAELRERIHSRLVDVSKEEGERGAVARRARTALSEATLTTIHGFCESIIEVVASVGGTPSIDTVLSKRRFEARLGHAVYDAIARAHGDEGLRRTLRYASLLGAHGGTLVAMAPRVAERDDKALTHEPLLSAPLLEDDIHKMVATVVAANEELRTLGVTGDDPSALPDKLMRQCGERPRHGDEGLVMLVAVGSMGSGQAPKASTTPARRLASETIQTVGEWLLTTRSAMAAWLIEWLRFVVKTDADARESEGLATFQDQLRRARDLMLNDQWRALIRDRIHTLVVDEYQDTDPVQAHLMRLLSVPLPKDQWELGPGEDPPSPLRDDISGEIFEPGRICVVGDERQSIYRFRGADHHLFRATRDHHFAAINQLALTSNFRSAAAVLEFVNGHFSPDSSDHPLISTRTLQGSVHILGVEMDEKAEVVWETEARDVAAAIATILDEGWQVEESGETRAARPSDIAVLMPTGSNAGRIIEALRERQISVDANGGNLGEIAEVHDALLCLTAIADPYDDVALLGALRTPLYGCSDDELREYVAGTPLSSRGAPIGDGLVAQSLADIRWWRDACSRMDAHQIAVGFLDAHQWSAICAFSEQPNLALRGCAGLLQLLDASTPHPGSALGTLVEELDDHAEDDPPSWTFGSDGAVALSTIHKAKGLEYPIVIVTGLGGTPKNDVPSVVLDRQTGKLECRLGTDKRKFQTSGFDQAWQAEQVEAAQEKERLIYVALTRARDHLIVGTHRKPSPKTLRPVDALVATAQRLGLEQMPLVSSTHGLVELALWDEGGTVKVDERLSEMPDAAKLVCEELMHRQQLTLDGSHKDG